MEYPAREDETGDLSKCEYSQTGTLGSARCSHPGEFESGVGFRLCLFHWGPEDAKGRRLKDGIFTARFSELVFDFEVHHEDTSFGVRLDCRGFVFPEGFSFFNGRVVPPADFHFSRRSIPWAGQSPPPRPAQSPQRLRQSQSFYCHRFSVVAQKCPALFLVRVVRRFSGWPKSRLPAPNPAGPRARRCRSRSRSRSVGSLPLAQS